MFAYNSHLSKLIDRIESEIKNPEIGLPDEIFYFMGRLTPFINVDVLVKIPDKGYILTWREDIYNGKGWHVPGGIIRIHERMEHRVHKVANLELNICLKKIEGPVEINQIISHKKERSHFISMLYYAEINDENTKKILSQVLKNPKKINVFNAPPIDLLKTHKIYKNRINL